MSSFTHFTTQTNIIVIKSLHYSASRPKQISTIVIVIALGVINTYLPTQLPPDI